MTNWIYEFVLIIKFDDYVDYASYMDNVDGCGYLDMKGIFLCPCFFCYNRLWDVWSISFCKSCPLISGGHNFVLYNMFLPIFMRNMLQEEGSIDFVDTIINEALLQKQWRNHTLSV